MSTQQEIKVVNTNATNKRVVQHGHTSVAVAAKSASESTGPSDTLASKPLKKHSRKRFQKKKFSEAFPGNRILTTKLQPLQTYGTGIKGTGAAVELADAAPVPAALGVVSASSQHESTHKVNDASQELVLEKFDKPNLNVDKKEFQDDMKKYGFKGLAASRWA
ncbi:hypothetical protein GL218_08163 [Daldinia childiae]|uniref:uncharacterized protein n=1 Tax=Daldinia childiae TaxID=326645 RepID=UPI0014477841|nr:uncharacterized protein GL218_08163 [Daldinia childiae]KAF3069039.1 hypothetical protein GL218_08163 [Daldinia childiae]